MKIPRPLRGILLAAAQTAAYAPIGGQAVIEGVMIRSPRRVATAVRRPTGEVTVKTEPFLSVLKRSPILRLPVIRGAAGLVESMVIGINSLSYSAEEATREVGASGAASAVVGAATAPGDPGATTATADDGAATVARPASGARFRDRLVLAGTLVFSLGLGIFVFFYLPLILTERTGVKSSIAFNLIDGVIRVAFLLLYLRLIGLWGEMRRIFEFHGAEHKAIHNFESGRPLSPETAATFTRLHPRCGTAFLLTVMVTGIIVFTFFGRPHTMGDRLLRLAAVPLIGGLAFEAIRFSGKNWHRPWIRSLAWPGLQLQLLTTREPDLEQLAVAIRAVESVTPLEDSDRGELRVM